jgi:peptidoglycan/LPS O-acetylase OafA/YrhL
MNKDDSHKDIMTNPLDITIPTTRTSIRPTKLSGRLQFLDAIRAIAAMAVVMEHSLETFYTGYGAWAGRHFSLGVFGVSTFFLVSGFIIPVTAERHHSAVEFWKSRFFRLYPAYWFSLVIAIVLGLLGFHGPSWVFHDPHPARIIAANITMFQEFMKQPDISGVYWTLAMELAFYILCSILLLLKKLDRSMLWAWVAVAINFGANIGFAFARHHSLPAGRMGLLVNAFTGAVVFRIYQQKAQVSQLWRFAPALALSLLCGFWLRFLKFPSSTEGGFAFESVVISYVGAYLLFFVLYGMRDREFPIALTWLGKISYSLYLLHGIALIVVPKMKYPLLSVACVFAVAIPVAAGGYYSIERSGLRLQRWLEKRRTTSATAKANSSALEAA